MGRPRKIRDFDGAPEDAISADIWHDMDELPERQTKVVLLNGEAEEPAELRTTRAYSQKRWRPYKHWVSMVTLRPIEYEPQAWKVIG